MKNRIVNLVLIGVIVVLASMLVRSCEKNKTHVNMLQNIQDTITYYVNEQGQQTAQIAALEAESKRLFLKAESKDSTVKWLQSVVKNYKGKINTGVVLATETKTVEVVKEVKVTEKDTIIKDSIIFVYPEYAVQWDNRWEQGFIKASKDSIQRDIKIKNDYEITLGRKSNKWFKPREYVVEVKSLNPNTVTTDLKTFTVKPKPKRFVLSVQLGYGLDLVNLKPSPFVGIGLGVVLLEIK